VSSSSGPDRAWPHWSGPRGNFTAVSPALRDSWRESKPEIVWIRELGEGYSGISAVGDRLFTMVSRDGHEVAVALDASSGNTIWEHDYEAPIIEGMAMENGAGPHSTPCYFDGSVYTIGVTGILHRLDAKTGDVVWVRKCIEDFGGSVLGRGYSSHPIVYGDAIVTPVGGEGHAVVAFKLSDGEVKWQSGGFRISHSSPMITTIDGQDMFVFFADHEFAGIDPERGTVLWRHPHDLVGGHICSTPIAGEPGELFFSTAYNGGSWCLEVSRSTDSTDFSVNERWFTNALNVHHSNAVYLDGAVFAPSGSFGPKIFSGLDLSSGDILWKNRDLARCNTVRVGDKIVALGEEGELALARITREGLEVLGRHQLFEDRAWTPPTLVGKKLYVRNRTHVMAVALP
jgi:outer membrane protein assembly factor BamB